MGEGDVYRAGERLLRVGYEIALYQEWGASPGGQLTPGHYEVAGHLMAPPEALDALLGTQAPLTLHLDDGRKMDCYVVNQEGAITPADERGLYV